MLKAIGIIFSADLSAYKVTLGAHDRWQPSEGTVVAGVASFVIHPQYNLKKILNDVAVLTLDRRIEYGDTIQPVCLAEVDPQPGSLCMATGWGARNRKDGTFQNCNFV